MVVLTLLLVWQAIRDKSRLEGQEWTLTAVQGSEVALLASHGVCGRFERVALLESANTVAIAVIHRENVGSGDDCPAVAVETCHRVTLREPLGDRRLAYLPPHPYPRHVDALLPGELPGARDGGALGEKPC